MVPPNFARPSSRAPRAGLPPTVFAAAVPNNVGRTIASLVEELQAEQGALAARMAEQQAAAAAEQKKAGGGQQ